MNIYDYMEELIETVPIGSRGVMYHPYLLAGGERAPFTDSRARASYTGISVRHTIVDIVRATYEGVAFAMLDCYQHMPQEIKQDDVMRWWSKEPGMEPDVCRYSRQQNRHN